MTDPVSVCLLHKQMKKKVFWSYRIITTTEGDKHSTY